jgi:hypothetical protein
MEKKIALLSLARAIEKNEGQDIILKYAKQCHPFDCCDIPDEQFAKVCEAAN